MDDQSVVGFIRLKPEEIDFVDQCWLVPVYPVGKIDRNRMIKEIKEGTMAAWQLPKPAQGIAVTYPEEGRLFIYYLRGKGLFGSLTTENLLEAARGNNLKGVRCWASNSGMKRILSRLGFKAIDKVNDSIVMELEDGWCRSSGGRS